MNSDSEAEDEEPQEDVDEGTSSISISDEPDVEGEPVEGEPVEGEPAEVDDTELPMVEVVPKDRKVRHDWYLGLGLGLGGGWANIKADNAFGLTESDSGGGFGGMFFVHGGGRLRQKVYLGGRVVALLGKDIPVDGVSLMLEVLYFPIANRGLVLGAGVGPSVLVGTDDMSKTSRSGAGLAVDIGYDFWLLKRLNLGVVLQANAVLNNSQAQILMGTLGLQVNFY